MTRREQLRPVLEAEVKRWSALSVEQLISELKDVQAFQVKFDSKEYNVEVQLLENTNSYVHVCVAAHDGRPPTSFHPLSESFIIEKSDK